MKIDRLSQEEKESLLEVSRRLMKKVEPSSVTAYGSKVAGYAREDSDYDLIVTAPRFPGRIQYKYVDEPIKTSALIVEDGLLLRDARKSVLGEFVSGRLLNVHQALLNPSLVREVEIEAKKRVTAESLYDLAAQYGEFSQDFIIPFEYFLFEKLHRRALVYPPALYSYVMTYTCDMAAQNVEASVQGFRAAARLLREEHDFFSIDEELDSVRLSPDKMKGRSFARLLSMLNLTSRGVRQYAVHGYAGRVGLSVFKDEAISKVKRLQRKTEPPPQLLHPKSLLRLEEGLLVPKTSELTPRLAEANGFKEYTRHSKTLGDVISTAKVVTIRGESTAKYVFKYFGDLRLMKWVFLNIWSLSLKFSLSPYARMHREYYVGRRLREVGVMTPMTLAVAIDDKVLVKEFIEGQSLETRIAQLLKDDGAETSVVRNYGRVLGKAHQAGFALGDAKAGNALVKEGVIYFTDLEQSVHGGDQPWDIAEFLYFTSKLSFNTQGLKRVAEAFLDGYSEVNGKSNIVRAKSEKYLAPFVPVVSPQILVDLREMLDRYGR